MLSRLQNRLQRYILEADDAVLPDVSGPDEGYQRTRLRIYYDAYRLRLIGALATDYEVLKRWTGDERFHALARGYIDDTPSTFRNLRWFGGALAEFLRNNAGYRSEPMLAELAEFEWSLGLAFDAPDAPQLAFKDLASIPVDDWPYIRFISHPSLRVLRPHWNVIAVWHAVKEGGTLPAPESSRHNSEIAVWRREHSTCFRSLDRDEATLWQSISGGKSFGDACGTLASRMDAGQAPEHAAGLLRLWVDDGWLQRYEIRR